MSTVKIEFQDNAGFEDGFRVYKSTNPNVTSSDTYVADICYDAYGYWEIKGKHGDDHVLVSNNTNGPATVGEQFVFTYSDYDDGDFYYGVMVYAGALVSTVSSSATTIKSENETPKKIVSVSIDSSPAKPSSVSTGASVEKPASVSVDSDPAKPSSVSVDSDPAKPSSVSVGITPAKPSSVTASLASPFNTGYTFPNTGSGSTFSGSPNLSPSIQIRILNSWHPHLTTGSDYTVVKVQISSGVLTNMNVLATDAGVSGWVGIGSGRGTDWEVLLDIPASPSNVSVDSDPTKPSSISVSAGTAPAKPSSVTVGTAPAKPSSVTVGTAPAKPSSVTVGTAPAKPSSVTVGTAPAKPSSISVGTAPAKPSSVTVGTAPAKPSSVTASQLSGVLWTPANLSNTFAWYDASDSTSIYTNTVGGQSQVTSWGDKTANNNDLIAADNPVTGSNTQNSLNVIDLDGGDYFELNNLSTPTSGNLQAFIVCEVTAVNNNADCILSMDAASNDWQLSAGNASQFRGAITFTSQPTTYTATGANAGLTGFRIFCADLDFTDDGQYRLLVDGELNAGTNERPYTSKLAATVNFRVFANRGENQFPQGSAAEVILLDSTSDADRQKVEGYLAHKWGIENLLDVSHPYKNSAPSTGPVAPSQPSSVAVGVIPNQPASITTSIYVPPAVQTFKVTASPYASEIGNTFTAVAVNPAYYNAGLTPSGGPHSYQSSSGNFLSRNIDYFTATPNGDRFWYGSTNNGGGNNSGYDQIDGTQQNNFGWSFSNFTY